MCASQVTFSLYALDITIVNGAKVDVAAASFAQAPSFTLRKGRLNLICNVISPEVTVGSSERVG
eukprot:3221048-Pyramimonas_sp.AAC.1